MTIVRPTVSATTREPPHVVPAQPDEPGVPFGPIADDAYDVELEAIARERDRVGNRALAAVRVFSIVAAGLLAFALRHDLRYALASSSPTELPAQASEAELERATHRYVSMKGIPGGVGAVDYRRPIQGGRHRLAPLVDQPNVYAELRLPDGIDPARFVPPTTVTGRLVPLDDGGVRFGDARALIEGSTGQRAPAPAYLIEVGARPSLRAPAALLGVVALLVCAAQALLLVGQLRRSEGRVG
jgi:hypothetical protein